MKIKRVEIQAFKSYTHKKDGTFDFTVNEGQPAEIVSILAPNGFGKTSFYDAIDFCMTNNITRFIRDSSLANVNNTDAKGLNQGGQKQHILRAMSAPEDVESIIKITTDTDNFERKVIRARTGSKDYAFDDKKTKPEERYFRSVMLSQEAIDGFLRELKPDVRYEKFMAQQLGGDDTLDKNRQHIQSILGRVNSRLEGTQRDVDEINNKNVLIELGGEPVVDSSCLTVINELTSELNRQGCEFSVFDDAFDEQLHSKLLLQIAQIEEKSHEKIEVVKAEESKLIRLVNNFPLYEKSHCEIEELNNKISKLTKQKSDIELLQVLNEKRSLLIERLDALRVSFEGLQSRDKFFPTFVKQMNAKHEYSEKLALFQETLTIKELALKNSYAVLAELEGQKTIIVNKNDRLEVQRKDALKHFAEISRINENIEKLNSVGLKARSIELERSIDNLKSEGVEINNFKIEDLDGVVASRFSNNTLLGISKSYSDAIISKKGLNNRLIEIKGLLDAEKIHKDSVSTLIKLGSQLISHNQDQHCPLCQKKHESFAALANAINSNSSLSESEQRHLKEIETCNALLHKEDNNLKILSEDFTGQKVIRLSLLRAQLKTCLNEQKEINNTFEQILKGEAEVNRLKELTAHKKPDLFNEYIDGEILVNAEVNALLETKIDVVKVESKKLNQDAQSLKVDFARSANKSESDSESLADYLVFLAELGGGREFIEPKLNEQGLKEIVTSQLKSAENLFEKVQREVKAHDEELSALNSKYIVSFIENPVEKVKGLSLSITEFSERLVVLNEYVREFYTMSKQLGQEHLLDCGSWGVLKEKFAHEISSLHDLTEQGTVLDSKLTLLATLAEQVLEYIRIEKSVDKLKKLEFKIERYSGIKEALLDDLRVINDSLKAQVDDYFHVDLINTIYEKIDPHPEFKRISFRCIFPDDGKPKLQVYIKDGDGNNVVSPTLSFSSAQVNVLSLSIFLAKALYTKNDGKDVDCIFIDDPVQSMDSINVLGVIDLFRNLSVNLGKQIIISTHDENFHALLKQKLPEHLFKSKFMELESFGKVAPHAGQ